MAADGWRYDQGQGAAIGLLVRSILELTIKGSATTKEASSVAAIALGYRGGHWNLPWSIEVHPAL